jgi:hypothetical protein
MVACMPRFIPLVVLGLLFATPLAAGEVYRTVGPDGEVTYTDEPPSKSAKPVKLPPIQVVSPYSRTVPAAPSASSGSDLAGGAPLSAKIISPAADETFRNADGTLSVSVQLPQPLPEGYGLKYLLDGIPQNGTATRNLNFTLEGVERGEHLISVVTVDARGTEVGRATPVVVHVKPPTVANAERLQAEREARREQNQKPKPKPAP